MIQNKNEPKTSTCRERYSTLANKNKWKKCQPQWWLTEYKLKHWTILIYPSGWPTFKLSWITPSISKEME